MTAEQHSGAVLAYLGDAVFELYVRKALVNTGITDVGKLNAAALKFVKATAQSEGLEKILPILTEEETYIFKRGRNANGVAIPKSASAAEYRRATGFEALSAYLYLHGDDQRLSELFETAFGDILQTLKPEGMNQS